MKLTLSVRANHLKNVAGVMKGTSDPFAVITILPMDLSEKPHILGKTEIVKNTLDPDFVTSFTVDYNLGRETKVLVKLYDHVSKGDNMSMGSTTFEIGNVLGSKGSIRTKKLKDDRGTITIKVEELKDFGRLKLKLGGVKIKNRDGWLNKSDPFYEIWKKEVGGNASQWNVVHRSSYIKDDLNPDWNLDTLDLGLICSGNRDELLVLKVFDHEGDGDHKLMGEMKTSVNQLVSSIGSEGYTLVRKGEDTGKIIVHVAEIIESGAEEEDIPVQAMSNVKIGGSTLSVDLPQKKTGTSFVDYIRGGCEISLHVAIDFTGSNGDPRLEGTLHYIHRDGSYNDYEKAIKAVGDILLKYDSDKLVPVFGFGAKFDGVVNHCFQCGPEEEVQEVEGIINAYRQTFASGLILSSPTVFTDVIQNSAARAMNAQGQAFQEGKQKYTVLLILTDGAVSDVEATARCIDTVDSAPLSIVIVGIGNADFGAMQFIDDSSSDVDIAQFVKFNDYKDNLSDLTSAVLDEIPKQLEKCFASRGVLPNPPEVVDEEEEIVLEAEEEEEIDLSIAFDENGNIIY